MTQFYQTVETAIWNILHRMTIVDALDILIVAVLIYEVMMLTRQTRGGSVVKGVAFFLLVAAFSNLFGFISLNWLLRALLTNGVLALIILFQPEMRKAMESLGRGTFFVHSIRKQNADEQKRIINEIIQTMRDLSQRKVGALIVFERKTGMNDIIETGTLLNARISAPLLENIFEPNTPLHDGAVIIRGDTVMAAGCIIVTLTENRGVSQELGTRHRAGIGVTETTDALVLIVSEETGTMSVASGGQIRRPLTEKQIRRELNQLYAEPKKHKSLLHLIKDRVEEEEA